MNAVDEGVSVKPPQPLELHSAEAEQAVLGSVLLDNGALDRVGDDLCEADFFHSQHRVIWRAAVALVAANKPADLFTVHEALQQAGAASEAGGMAYLNALQQSVASSANVRHYASIVRERAVVRAIVAAAEQAQAAAVEAGLPAADKIDRAVSLFTALQTRTVRSLPRRAGDVLLGQIDRWNALADGTAPAGIPTGIPALDRALNGGLREGKVYILAARPSVGKSSLAQAIALHLVQQGHPALVLSLEMEASECIDRAAANVARVAYDRLQTGQLEPEDWTRLLEGAQQIQALPLFVDDQAALTLAQIRAKAVSLRREGIKLLVLDYLQLCDYGDTRGKSTNDALANVSKGLKRLAKDLGLAVLVLSQLNRDVEKRSSPEPELSDLRDSGAIEQDADVVLMLWRARVFEDRAIVGLKLPKNRQGKAGRRIALEFQGHYQRWYESEASLDTPRDAKQAKGFA